jgi:rhodanese-related sulfurtransferase
MVRAVTPEEISSLLEQGHLYIDVRSEPEFEKGHVPGALNVPLLHLGMSGMTLNPEFLQVMEAAFDKNAPLILGCRAGPRSRRAAELLQGAGFTNLSEMAVGWEGSRDAFGRVTPGYSKKNLPIETGVPRGRAYADVKQRIPR